MRINTDKHTLEKKAWYRLIKVVYFIIYSMAILLVVLIASGYKPYTYIDNDKSLIICNNNKIYSAGKNNIYINLDGTLFDYSDFQTKKLCSQDPDFIPDKKNYTLRLEHTTRGSWTSVIEVFLIETGVVIIIFELIKRIFLYITIGKSFLPKFSKNE